MQTQRIERVTTDPVVTLDEIKKQLIVEHDEDDVIIARHTAAAIAYAENNLDRSLVLRRYRASGACWPFYRGRYMFPLCYGPVRQIESVDYIDCDGVTQSIDSEKWQIVPSNGGHLFHFHDCPPSVSVRHLDAVQVTYTAGYGALPDDVGNELGYPYTLPMVFGGVSTSVDLNNTLPDNIRHAVYMLAAHWYENREAVVVGTGNSSVAIAVDCLLDQERVRGT